MIIDEMAIMKILMTMVARVIIIVMRCNFIINCLMSGVMLAA